MLFYTPTPSAPLLYISWLNFSPVFFLGTMGLDTPDTFGALILEDPYTLDEVILID